MMHHLVGQRTEERIWCPHVQTMAYLPFYSRFGFYTPTSGFANRQKRFNWQRRGCIRYFDAQQNCRDEVTDVKSNLVQ